MSDTVETINVELQLLDWSNSARGGPKVVFALPDEEALEQFKAMTLPTGRGKERICGQRLMAALVQIGDDEQPVQKSRPGPLCQLAVLWCAEEEFGRWCFEHFPDHWPGISELGMEGASKAVILSVCGVESRRDLDVDAHAAQLFHALIREPYQQHLQREE